MLTPSHNHHRVNRVDGDHVTHTPPISPDFESTNNEQSISNVKPIRTTVFAPKLCHSILRFRTPTHPQYTVHNKPSSLAILNNFFPVHTSATCATFETYSHEIDIAPMASCSMHALAIAARARVDIDVCHFGVGEFLLSIVAHSPTTELEVVHW